jgi:hypothetical protein
MGSADCGPTSALGRSSRGGKWCAARGFPDLIQMVCRQKNPALTKQNLEKQIARCRRDLSRMGSDAATESLRAFLADLEDRLRNLETQ